MTRYGNGRIAAWLAIVLLLAAGNYATRFGAAGSGTASRDALYHYSTAIAAYFFYGIMFAFVYAIAAIDTGELFALRRPRSWPRALGLGAGVIVAVYILYGIVSTLPLPQSPGQEQGLTPSHWEPRYAGAYAANFVAVALVAPFVEELTFRGVGYRLLLPFGRALAIVAVGVAFGVAHGLIEGLLVLIPFGIALAWLRSRTDSVLPGMLIHALFNAAALLLILVR